MQNKSIRQNIASYYAILDSIVILDSKVVSIPACHAGDRGSIPRQGGQVLLLAPQYNAGLVVILFTFFYWVGRPLVPKVL